jgi:predicted nuclease with TOPRIM domain
MTIKVAVTCNHCKDDIEIGTDTSGVDDVVCLFCWQHRNEVDAEELAEAKAGQAELIQYTTRLFNKLEETREQLRRVEAETALTDRLAEAQARIAELEAELAERDSFEEYDYAETDQALWVSGREPQDGWVG